MKRRNARTHGAHVEVTPEERYHMINDVAYFRAAQKMSGDKIPQDQADAWCEVESEIDAILKRHHAD